MMEGCFGESGEPGEPRETLESQERLERPWRARSAWRVSVFEIASEEME
jgi:hypothetical protein